jgi:hypothetical protein
MLHAVERAAGNVFDAVDQTLTRFANVFCLKARCRENE